MDIPLRIAMLISGGGTTMQAIIRACQSGALKGLVEPVIVIASTSKAGGIAKAQTEGVETQIFKRHLYENINRFGEAIISACRKAGANFIGQYGWLKLTPPNVIAAFPGMMVNQHPGPLDLGRPDFGGDYMYGKRVHAARLYFVQATGRDWWTEATTHRVWEKYDEGSVLGRRLVQIWPDDTVDSLQQRVLPVEHELQIDVLADFAAGRVQELVREQPLVPPEEYQRLADCKDRAIADFPHG